MKVGISMLPVNGRINLDRGYTDLIKIICCLLVAASHYAQNYIISGEDYGFLLNTLSTQGGYLGVSFFFFFSGYGLMSSQLAKHDTFCHFIKRRLLKVYLPAIYVSIIWLVSLYTFPLLQKGINVPALTHETMDILRNFGGVFFLNFYDSVLWFVKIILALYMVVYLYIRIKCSSYSHLRLLFLALSTLSVTILTYYAIAPFASVSVPIFALGIIIAEFNNRISERIMIYGITSLTLICILSVLGRHNHVLLHGMINYSVIVIWLMTDFYYPLTVKGIPVTFTNCSYDIYITHKKILIAMGIVFGTFSLWTFLLVAIIVAFVEFKSRKLIGL